MISREISQKISRDFNAQLARKMRKQSIWGLVFAIQAEYFRCGEIALCRYPDTLFPAHWSVMVEVQRSYALHASDSIFRRAHPYLA